MVQLRFCHSFLLGLCAMILGVGARAAEPGGNAGPSLTLEIRDATTGERTPARFTVLVDGKGYEPARINEHGLLFTSTHVARRQAQTFTYARGTGPVEFALPKNPGRVTVHVAKGFEYRPASVTVDPQPAAATHVAVSITRWAHPGADGWFATDEHVHYDRRDPAANRDWFAMMAGDDLSHLHFMMLKGGQVPGEWGVQYGYGPAGEAGDGRRTLTAGEEYRDSAQGHIVLLGVREVIQPVMTGVAESPDNYPPLHSVLLRARELGSFNGVAHGGSLGRESTAVTDAVLGGLDFFEIANAFMFAPELWYQLMNCGYHLPPAAGTDLPNYPFRDPWQPFLGSMRMYVRIGDARDFATWRQKVQRSEVYITSGPLLSFTVNGKSAGSDVILPTAGEVMVEAELSSPFPLEKFELVSNGLPVPAEIARRTDNGIHRWKLRHRLPVQHSSWLAVRGRGISIHTLKQHAELLTRPTGLTDAMAHSAAVRVLVAGKPIRSTRDAETLIALLEKQRGYYQRSARYSRNEHREEMIALLDRAAAELRKRR